MVLQQDFNGHLTALQWNFNGTSLAQKIPILGVTDVNIFVWYFINSNKKSKCEKGWGDPPVWIVDKAYCIF